MKIKQIIWLYLKNKVLIILVVTYYIHSTEL